MGELGLNKIFGVLLAIFLVVMGLREVSMLVFGGGGHHGEHEYASLNEWAEENFAYRLEMADVGAGADVVEEEPYDLGLLLAGADLGVGERSFNGKCKTCHTIEEGGSNGTGPNLYNIVGAAKGAHAGFNYSGALARTEGDWTYENMDAWLLAPSQYAAGTSMAFAGIRRDDERASLIAYLASYTPDAPPFPEPLPAEEESAEMAEDTVIEAAVTEASEGTSDVVETMVEDGASMETIEEAGLDAADVEAAAVDASELADGMANSEGMSEDLDDAPDAVTE